MKYLLIMFICSSVSGNKCQSITPKITEFKDHYDCAIHGYKYSYETIDSLSRKFVNDYSAYIQFASKETSST